MCFCICSVSCWQLECSHSLQLSCVCLGCEHSSCLRACMWMHVASENTSWQVVLIFFAVFYLWAVQEAVELYSFITRHGKSSDTSEIYAHTHGHWYYTHNHIHSQAKHSPHYMAFWQWEPSVIEMNAAQRGMWKIAHYFDSSLSMWQQSWWLSPAAALESMASSNSQEEVKHSPALSITPVSAHSS